MMPDTMETRVGRLEQAVARMNQQLEDQHADIKALAPLAVAFGRFELVVEQLEKRQRDDVERLHEENRQTAALIEALHKRLDQDGVERRERQEERDREDNAKRLALTLAAIAAVASIMAALIGAAAVVTS